MSPITVYILFAVRACDLALILADVMCALMQWRCRFPGHREGSSRKLYFKYPSNTEIYSDATATDPGLLKKHSTFRSYNTPIATYPKIRIFYRPHPQADKLPDKPRPLPLLVFVHGLGGSLAQFHPILTSLVNVGPCLGIDLPGCGLSQFSPTEWGAYSINALAEVLIAAIEDHVDRENGQGVILIGHSMGCSLSAMVASSKSNLCGSVKFDIIGTIAICPKASVPPPEALAQMRKLLAIPTPIFDLWRMWDRRGGPDSVSVRRFVGAKADLATKKLQERFNQQSQTAVWRRMAYGLLPPIQASSDAVAGLPGLELWSGITCPIYLIAGEGDKITSPEEVSIISKSLRQLNNRQRTLDSQDFTASLSDISNDPLLAQS